jgi:hypothetical protein
VGPSNDRIAIAIEFANMDVTMGIDKHKEYVTLPTTHYQLLTIS